MFPNTRVFLNGFLLTWHVDISEDVAQCRTELLAAEVEIERLKTLAAVRLERVQELEAKVKELEEDLEQPESEGLDRGTLI